MTKHTLHLLYGKDGKWRLKHEGAGRAFALFSKKESALKKARALARREKVELVVHDMRDRIIDKDSFGSDPFPPRDAIH